MAAAGDWQSRGQMVLIVSTGTMDEISGRWKCLEMSKYGNFTATHCRAQPKTATPIPSVTKTDFSQDLNASHK